MPGLAENNFRYEDVMEYFKDDFGQKLKVHDESTCTGTCPIHNPSRHHMRDWPLFWRTDRCIFERQDPEGCFHPDPDDAKYRAEHGDFDTVHGCNGLCNPGLWEKYLKGERFDLEEE